MKKFFLALAIVALAATSMNAQTAQQTATPVKKECCKEHKDGQKCDKPADQQCPDCKAKAAAKQCDKAQGQKCDKAAMNHECKKAEGQKCDKAAMNHECKKAEGQKCDKPADQQCPDCKKANGVKNVAPKAMKKVATKKK